MHETNQIFRFKVKELDLNYICSTRQQRFGRKTPKLACIRVKSLVSAKCLQNVWFEEVE